MVIIGIIFCCVLALAIAAGMYKVNIKVDVIANE